MTTYVVEEFCDEAGRSPFAKWFNELPEAAATRVNVAVARMSTGNLSGVVPVGEGVTEYKVDFGPGYRIYFGQDGKSLIVLLAGGTKTRQGLDIRVAKERWASYKMRKKGRS